MRHRTAAPASPARTTPPRRRGVPGVRLGDHAPRTSTLRDPEAEARQEARLEAEAGRGCRSGPCGPPSPRRPRSKRAIGDLLRQAVRARPRRCATGRRRPPRSPRAASPIFGPVIVALSRYHVPRASSPATSMASRRVRRGSAARAPHLLRADSGGSGTNYVVGDDQLCRSPRTGGTRRQRCGSYVPARHPAPRSKQGTPRRGRAAGSITATRRAHQRLAYKPSARPRGRAARLARHAYLADPVEAPRRSAGAAPGRRQPLAAPLAHEVRATRRGPVNCTSTSPRIHHPPAALPARDETSPRRSFR